MKHTPGTWVAIPVKFPFHSSRKPIFEDGLWAILPEANLERVPICEVDHADDHDPPTRLKAEADARLIAAAPDLLAALKDVLAHGGSTDDAWLPMKYYRAAQAAIAKADPK